MWSWIKRYLDFSYCFSWFDFIFQHCKWVKIPHSVSIKLCSLQSSKFRPFMFSFSDRIFLKLKVDLTGVSHLKFTGQFLPLHLPFLSHVPTFWYLFPFYNYSQCTVSFSLLENLGIHPIFYVENPQFGFYLFPLFSLYFFNWLFFKLNNYNPPLGNHQFLPFSP